MKHSRGRDRRQARGRIELRVGVADIGSAVRHRLRADRGGGTWRSARRLRTRFGDTDARHVHRRHQPQPHLRRGRSLVRAAAPQLLRALRELGASELSADSARGGFAANGRCRGATRARARRCAAAMFGAHFVEVEVNLRSGRHTCCARCAPTMPDACSTPCSHAARCTAVSAGHGHGVARGTRAGPTHRPMLNAAMWAYRTPGVLDAPGHNGVPRCRCAGWRQQPRRQGAG